MFDTSLVRSRTVDGSRRFGVLTVSLAIHSAAIIAAISASLASVEFPSFAPDQLEVFTPVTTPSAPPPPLGRPAPARPSAAASASAVATAPAAPTAIPDAIPTLGPAFSGTAVATTTGTGEGPIGVENGVPGGIFTGDPPAVTNAVPEITYHPGGEVIPARVLRRVEPQYPQVMLRTRVAALVTVRCVIDRNGQIRDPEIVRSSYPPFNAAVLDAIRQWTFAPGSMRGRAVDTWFELTVRFDVR